MKWYFASFVVHSQSSVTVTGSNSAREYRMILQAKDSDAAYVKAIKLGSKMADTLPTTTRDEWIFDGLSDLLLVNEPPAPESELIWFQAELDKDKLATWIHKQSELRVFSGIRTLETASGWYVAELVLAETHDGGSHGDSILVWLNAHLISAPDAESAYRAAVELGDRQASLSGSHRCNGDAAHWVFKGLRDLIKTIDSPSDGAILWFDEFDVTERDLGRLIPQRSGLGIFEWEAGFRRTGG